MTLENLVTCGWLILFATAAAVLLKANMTLEACIGAAHKLTEAVQGFNIALGDLREEIRELRDEVRELRDYNELRGQAVVKERTNAPAATT